VPMSRNLGALTYWEPVCLFRPVMGQLYFLHFMSWLIMRRTVHSHVLYFRILYTG
jgi:hypothetical protein